MAEGLKLTMLRSGRQVTLRYQPDGRRGNGIRSTHRLYLSAPPGRVVAVRTSPAPFTPQNVWTSSETTRHGKLEDRQARCDRTLPTHHTAGLSVDDCRQPRTDRADRFATGFPHRPR